MFFTRIILSYAFLISFQSLTYSQSCQGFYKSSGCQVSEAKEFKQYGQARSAAVEIGQLYKYQVILYGKKDFIFSVCSEQGIKPIHMRIVDSKTNEVIYDNADDNYNRSIGFAMEKTTTANIEVEILTDKEKGDPTRNRVCIGVQIWWRKIPKLGFE
jgi:hypothetical protein